MDVKIAAELLTDYTPAQIVTVAESKGTLHQYEGVPVEVWKEAIETAYLCCKVVETDPLWCLRMITYIRRAYPYRTSYWPSLMNAIQDSNGNLVLADKRIRQELQYGLFTTAAYTTKGAREMDMYIRGEMQALEAMLTVDPATEE